MTVIFWKKEFTNLWFKNQGLKFCMSPWYHLRIPTRGHLVVKMIFQNFKFQIFVHYNEISKKFSSWSKKFKLHRKLNDGSPGYWEKYFGVSDMFLRHFKMHLKNFLEALFLQLLELTKFSKNRCCHILWSFELKILRKKLRGSDYMMCNFLLDPMIRWFFRRGLAYPTRHTVCLSLFAYNCESVHLLLEVHYA